MKESFFSDILNELGWEYSEAKGVFTIAIEKSRSVQLSVKRNPLSDSYYLQVALSKDYSFPIHEDAFLDCLQAMAITNAQMEAPALTLYMDNEEMKLSFRQVFYFTESGLHKEFFKSLLGRFLMLSDIMEPFLQEINDKKFSLEEFIRGLQQAKELSGFPSS